MKMSWPIISVAVVLPFGAFILYWVNVVLEARTATPRLLEAVKHVQETSINAIPARWIEYLVTVEDPSFWENDGIDFRSPGQGLTTLTQGLAKRLYFDRFTPGFQKIELILISKFALNAQASKQEIIEAVLSTAYFGEDERGSIIGFPDAARRLYNTELLSLTDDQFIGLAAMLIAPNAFNPERNIKAHSNRVERIKKLIAGDCEPAGLMDVYLEGCA